MIKVHLRRIADHRSNADDGLKEIEHGCVADHARSVDTEGDKLQDAFTPRDPVNHGGIVDGAFKLEKENESYKL
jgi:hypothetical protein